MKSIIKLSFAIFSLSASIAGAAPDWSKGAVVPPEGRNNPYDLAPDEFAASVRNGRLHALNYPVSVTGIVLPYEPLRRVVEADSKNPLRRVLQGLFGDISGMNSVDDFEKSFGLLTYPKEEGTGAYFVPFAGRAKPDHRMGITLSERDDLGTYVTVSCAQCHSGELFGKKIIGLTNRFPRANEMFTRAQQSAPHVSNGLFRLASEATDGEVEMFASTKKALEIVGAKKPVQLGLDSSLAQVALSLAKREKNAWATRPPKGTKPRYEALSKYVADSKPAVWWNVKYKNRYLADGSVVSGNPILTNFIWNEIGRGTDLQDLNRWFDENPQVIQELTTAVFSAEAPRYTDFFTGPDIERAKRGQVLFNESCARCHGGYEKAWDLPNASTLSLSEQLATTKVHYQTRVMNVGTDPQRAIGMRSLVQLNDLEVSKKNGILIEATEKYVPPPLVGIWARWPYFHNNSAPTLCAVLTPGKDRPPKYWARDAKNPATDFDADCNGYPASKPKGADSEFRYDTKKAGMRNTGHDEGIFTENGKSKFSNEQRRDLIRFLQTL